MKVRKIVKTMILVAVACVAAVRGKKKEKEYKETKEYAEKMSRYYQLYTRWLKMKQQGVSCLDYFRENEYKKIAIYGFKELGERLYEELKGSEVEVAYIIDKNVDLVWAEIDIYGLDEEFPEVDAIIVTPFFYFNEIEAEMCIKVNCPIVSIEDVIL